MCRICNGQDQMKRFPLMAAGSGMGTAVAAGLVRRQVCRAQNAGEVGFFGLGGGAGLSDVGGVLLSSSGCWSGEGSF